MDANKRKVNNFIKKRSKENTEPAKQRAGQEEEESYNLLLLETRVEWTEPVEPEPEPVTQKEEEPYNLLLLETRVDSPEPDLEPAEQRAVQE